MLALLVLFIVSLSLLLEWALQRGDEWALQRGDRFEPLTPRR